MEALIARAIQVLIALGGAYILTLWFAIVVWTFQDIQARSRSVVAQIFSTLVVMIFSIPGLLVYMILRPRYTLDDAFQRSLEEEYLMQDLEELPLCPGCQQFVEDEWVFCPNCRAELRDNCISCDRLIDLRWEICPYCGTEQYEDEDLLPEPILQPVIAPSPQYLGRPQMNHADVFRLAESQDRTRPIIPATVRVDLRSGDVATEYVPELPLGSSFRPLSGLSEPRRVSLEGNGFRDPDESSETASEDPVDVDQVDAADDREPAAVLTEEFPDSDAAVVEHSTGQDTGVEDTSIAEGEDLVVAGDAAGDDETASQSDASSSELARKPSRKRRRKKKNRESSSDSS